MIPIAVFVVYFKFFDCSASNETNLAFGKMAFQSSDVSTDTSGFMAVDGDYTKCFISLSNGYQWFFVDLMWNHAILGLNLTYSNNKTIVKNYNPTLAIFSYNPTQYLLSALPLSSIPRCSTNSTCSGNASSSCTLIYDCYNHIGRFVAAIQSQNISNQMYICEIEVFGNYAEVFPKKINILYRKNIHMSSTYAITGPNGNLLYYNATTANDGIHDTEISHFVCAHTNDVGFSQNWYQVDMADEYQIDYIAFTNRLSSYSAFRADYFIIGLTNYSYTSVPIVRGQYPLCNVYPGTVPSGARVTMDCNAMLPSYRYFIAQLGVSYADGFFTICEIEAYPPISKSFIWKRNKGIRLSGYLLQSITKTVSTTKTVLATCVFACMNIGICDSINYNPSLQICELNQHRNGYKSGKLLSNAGWSFYTVVYSAVGKN